MLNGEMLLVWFLASVVMATALAYQILVVRSCSTTPTSETHW